MADPFTIDGATLVASYEHVSRSLELDGIPFAGWSEMTGGGTSREGRVLVYGAGDEPRGLTNGKVKPGDLTLKLEVATHRALKAALRAKALAFGDASATAHQKIDFQLVDQFRGANFTQASLTLTYTVRIGAETPNTPNSGEQFYQELTLNQVSVAKEKFG